jgi:hypothetical protein
VKLVDGEGVLRLRKRFEKKRTVRERVGEPKPKAEVLCPAD